MPLLRETTGAQPNLLDLIRRFVWDLGGDLPRTKLVKLVYMADEECAWLTGATYTGLNYVFDNFGPNAEGNEIVRATDRLAAAGEVRILHKTTARGVLILNERGPEASAPQLPDLVAEIVTDLEARCRRLSVDEVSALSKRTRPFLDNPARGDRLRLEGGRVRAKRRLATLRQSDRYVGRADPADLDVPTHHEPVGGWLDQEQERLINEAT